MSINGHLRVKKISWYSKMTGFLKFYLIMCIEWQFVLHYSIFSLIRWVHFMFDFIVLSADDPIRINKRSKWASECENGDCGVERLGARYLSGRRLHSGSDWLSLNGQYADFNIWNAHKYDQYNRFRASWDEAKSRQSFSPRIKYIWFIASFVQFFLPTFSGYRRYVDVVPASRFISNRPQVCLFYTIHMCLRLSRLPMSTPMPIVTLFCEIRKEYKFECIYDSAFLSLAQVASQKCLSFRIIEGC